MPWQKELQHLLRSRQTCALRLRLLWPLVRLRIAELGLSSLGRIYPVTTSASHSFATESPR